MSDPWREAFLTVSDWASALTDESGTSVAASREENEIRLGFARDDTEDVLVLRAGAEGGEPVLRATRREIGEEEQSPPAEEAS